MLKKYVILMMATLMVICASSVAMADEHVCDFKFMAVSAEPDCVNPGQEWWHCDCGADDMRTVAKDEDNHNFVNGVCTRCGEEEELEFVPDQKPDNGNKPNKPSKKPTKRCKHEWIVGAEVEANCKYEGSIVYMCAKGCGKEYTETTEINRKNHNYNDDNVCVNCGKAKRCRHEWIVGYEVEANCTYEGAVGYMCAKGCGAEYEETTEINRKNHNYNDDNVCVNCGKAKRCRHEWIVGYEVEANCTYEGTVGYMCAKGCGAEYEETTEINLRNHNYGNDNVCDDCGNIKRSRRTRMTEETEAQTIEYTEYNENRGFEYLEETEETEETESASRRSRRNARSRSYGSDVYLTGND